MGRKKDRREDRGPREVKASWKWFEVALGDDGFGRGDPDPILLLALYRTVGDKAELICRGLSRVNIASPYPASVDADEAPTLARVLPPGEYPLGLIAIALEEDGGTDVQRLYAMFERGDFTLWSSDHPEPEPKTLAEWIESDADGVASVDLLAAGEQIDASCKDDRLVGVTISTFHSKTLKSQKRIANRLHFRSGDGKNDWTSEVVVRL